MNIWYVQSINQSLDLSIHIYNQSPCDFFLVAVVSPATNDCSPMRRFLLLHQDVTKQPLFGWASNERGSQGLLLRLVITYAVIFAAVCWPIAGATYTEEGYLLQKVASANVGAMTVIGFLLLRISTGWGYLGDRLTSKVIEYEETGWYDGDWELKTEAERKRDKFLYMDKVKPVVDRLKVFSAATAGLWVASIVAFNVASNMQPLYDQYDPRMLERLSYDDKLADRAASNSVGKKPTYCDNRYYREVAGGNQCR